MEYRRIYAKIDLDALEHNLNLIKSKIPDGVGIMPIVKADAYGHGAVEVSKFLEDKCDCFGVAVLDEAIELRHAGIKAPILLLGYTSPEQYEKVIEYGVSITVFSYSDAVLLNQAGEKCGKTALVHIAVDTGMSRIGYQVNDADADEAARIFKLSNVKVEGVFSHYATADEEDKTFAIEQKTAFDKFVSMLKARGCEAASLHMNNSAGIMEMSNSCYDTVRAGIILYGLYPSEEVDKMSFPLRPVMELITHISHIKTLPAGRGISYGRTYITDKDTRVATIPVGYADGYPRALSNKGKVIIGGVTCPIIGRVCMDQMMVDVTDLPDANVGDKVVLFGKDGEEFLTVEEVADAAYSFNYEFVCNIGRRVPKAYFRNGEHVKTVSYLE